MGLVDMLKDQWTHMELPISQETCRNKTYIVVGGNQGLGLEAIRHLAANDAKKVICTVRNMTAGEAAKKDVESTTGTRGIVDVWKLDLGSFDSVKAFAKKVNAELDQVHAVISNASLANGTFKLSDGGHEESLTVNVYSTFLLSFLLMPKLSETAKVTKQSSHLVIVSSEVSFLPAAKSSWDRVRADPVPLMDDVKVTNMAERYPFSKLVQVLVARQAASLLPVDRTGVIVDYVNPGLCKTNLSRNGTFGTRLMVNTMKNLIGRTADQGSRVLLYGTVVDKSCHGSFLSTCRQEDHLIPAWVTDEDGKRHQQRMWTEVSQELERIQPGCVKKVLQLAN